MGFIRGGAPAISAVTLIALLWMFFHPLPADQISIPVVGIAIAAVTLSLSRVSVVEIWQAYRLPSTLVAAVVAIALLSSQVVAPGLQSSRVWLVVLAVLMLGFLLGMQIRLKLALFGVLVGAIAVAVVGWVLRIDDGVPLSLNFLNGANDFVGLTGNQGYEFFSALLGFAAGVELLLRRARYPAVVAVGVLFCALTLVSTGSVVGLVSLAAAVLAAGLRLGLSKNPSGVLRFAPWVFAATVAGAFSFFVANRGLTTDLVGVVGKSTSLDARMASWQYALQSVDFPGFLFGHGVSFWAVGSPYREAVGQRLALDGYSSFSHAHNAYMDFFLSFGVVGVGLLVVALFLAIRTTKRLSGENSPSDPFVWILFTAVAMSSLGESIATARPISWFFAALLLGSYLGTAARLRQTTTLPAP